MIKFEFTVRDVDAQNILDILNNERVRVMIQAEKHDRNASRLSCASDAANRDWCEGHAEYLKGLIDTMAKGSKRVDV